MNIHGGVSARGASLHPPRPLSNRFSARNREDIERVARPRARVLYLQRRISMLHGRIAPLFAVASPRSHHEHPLSSSSARTDFGTSITGVRLLGELRQSICNTTLGFAYLPPHPHLAFPTLAFYNIPYTSQHFKSAVSHVEVIHLSLPSYDQMTL